VASLDPKIRCCVKSVSGVSNIFQLQKFEYQADVGDLLASALGGSKSIKLNDLSGYCERYDEKFV